MESYTFIWMAVAIGALLICAYWAGRKRQRELSEWAHNHGLNYDKSKCDGVGLEFADLKCLQRGHSRYAYNVMTGMWQGAAITAFDYHYATGHGKNRSDHRFSAVVILAPLPLQPLLIRREHFFDKLTEFFGFDDIDFESAEFSRKFYVKASDRKWAFDVIHQRMMDYLLSGPNVSVEFGFSAIVAYGSGKFKPSKFSEAAQFISGIIERFPDYLVRQQEALAQP